MCIRDSRRRRRRARARGAFRRAGARAGRKRTQPARASAPCARRRRAAALPADRGRGGRAVGDRRSQPETGRAAAVVTGDGRRAPQALWSGMKPSARAQRMLFCMCLSERLNAGGRAAGRFRRRAPAARARAEQRGGCPSRFRAMLPNVCGRRGSACGCRRFRRPPAARRPSRVGGFAFAARGGGSQTAFCPPMREADGFVSA